MDNTDETTRKHDQNDTLINSFCEITSATPQEAHFFLESHQWDLDAALSTFLDENATASMPQVRSNRGREESSPEYSPSRSRSRSPSPVVGEELGRAPYELRSRGKNKKKAEGSGTRGGIRTLADLNRTPEGDEDDDDELQEYYTGGEKSGMLVQDPTNRYDADAIFDHAKNSGSMQRPTDRPSSSSRGFTGTARLLSGESVHVSAQPPETVTHAITLWRNGFTVDDGPLRRFDDPANTSFLESIKRSECPTELEPADRRTKVHLELMRREEDYSEPKKRQSKALFQGVGRTLGSSDSAEPTASNPSAPSSLMTAPLPTSGLVIDSSLPTTSIQLRLSDGTRMVSRFNLSHTISDMRAFIDASRPGGARNYQLQTMGFPPKPLTNLDQTIEEAGIANSVVIQKF